MKQHTIITDTEEHVLDVETQTTVAQLTVSAELVDTAQGIVKHLIVQRPDFLEFRLSGMHAEFYDGPTAEDVLDKLEELADDEKSKVTHELVMALRKSHAQHGAFICPEEAEVEIADMFDINPIHDDRSEIIFSTAGVKAQISIGYWTSTTLEVPYVWFADVPEELQPT